MKLDASGQGFGSNLVKLWDHRKNDHDQRKSEVVKYSRYFHLQKSGFLVGKRMNIFSPFFAEKK